ncbi:GH32 C-terminal domain-containing protein [Marinoscillum furvescens]|uniref:beta-fructofuranosidase n=1 Tax=Marinoscillum furvescens DSM 4134 TaxID=1122208 RepID=A0A3D9LG09_MARFU|nr:GH32 C-terminal domain-containing protein [Marinoscillum furvescens]REE05537.1 putative secreted protein (Por secretion system target) [Marinoscillum furvescens DSM 4134]
MNYRLLGVLFLTTTQILAQEVFHLNFDESSGTATTIEQISGQQLSINNLFGRPERIASPSGQALRLDGWSTYIQSPNFHLAGVSSQMTVEAWYATEAFNKESSSIIELFNSTQNEGFYLSVGPYGELNFGFHLDHQLYVHNTPRKLTSYRWHHIVAVINLEEGSSKIYVDGELWFLEQNLSATAISTGTATLYVGKRSLNQEANGFQVNVLNGTLDDVKVHDYALSEAQIQGRNESVTAREVALTIDPQERFAGDHLRPQYHPMPNNSWANEPYGLMYYKGLYHLFFQKNPNAPQLYFMHWGHLVSEDLVHWREVEIPLRPSPGFDNFGVWSGTSLKDNSGTPYLFYTGVDGAKAGIGSAISVDDSLLHWEEHPQNPLIPTAPTSFRHLDFRDPYLWEADGTYYMIVGSGLQDQGGGILFTYRSTDLVNWTMIPRLYTNSDTETYGEFWEMPTFKQLSEDTYMLQLLPTPQPGKPARSIYLLGSWENETFTPFTEEPHSLELFDSHMLAPAFGVDDETGDTYIGIIPEDRDGGDQIAAGWRQTFSVPRQVRLLEDSTLGQIPHPNLCRLRKNEMRVENLKLQNEERNNLSGFHGNQIELEFDIKADSNSNFIIQVLKHEDGQETTTIRFDYSLNKIILDRRQSSLSNTKKDTRIGDFVFNPSDTLNIRIFIDHSTLEVFVQNLTVFSSRVYPSRADSDLVDIVSISGGVEVIKASKWDMASMHETAIRDESCVPQNLPVRFNKLPEVPSGPNDPLGAPQNMGWQVYPNPADDDFQIIFSGGMSAEYYLYTLSGLQVMSGSCKEDITNIDVHHIPAGMYLLTASRNGFFYSEKLLIK